MRGIKTAAINYAAKDFYGTWDLVADVVETNNYLCVKSWEDLTKSPYAGKEFCTGFHDKAGKFTTGYAMIENTATGNPTVGLLACSQDKVTCGGAKYTTFADAKATKTTLTMKVADDKTACSFVLAATCDTPYVHVDGADYTAAKYADLVWSINEYQTLTSGQWADDTRGFTAADGKCAKLTLAQVKTVPMDTYNGNKWVTNANPEQANQLYPKAELYPIKAVAAVKSVAEANVLLALYAAKKKEFADFETAKAAYEKLRTDYNTKLTAAEKLQKDEINKDMFRKMTPTEADLKVLNAVPARPNYPTQPAAYTAILP